MASQSKQAKSKRALVTMGTSDYAELLTISRPRFQAYAAKHGYDYIELVDDLPPVPAPRPSSWLKVLPIAEMLEGDYDEVLWLGCDVLILDDTDDISEEVAAGMWQGMVAHHTDEGEIPNADVWLMRKPMAAYLRQMWESEKHINHVWWEQRAIMDLMGYGTQPCKCEKPTDLYEHTEFLPLEWNSHESADRSESPIFMHATHGTLEWRLEVMRRYGASE